MCATDACPSGLDKRARVRAAGLKASSSTLAAAAAEDPMIATANARALAADTGASARFATDTLDDVPVVDISAPRGSPSRAAAAAAVRAAAEGPGFVLVTGHGIPPATIDRALAATRSLLDFDQGAGSASVDLEWPEIDFAGGHIRGLTPRGGENIGRFMGRPGSAADARVVKYTIGPDDATADAMGVDRNVWPQAVPGCDSAAAAADDFRSSLSAYYDHAERVSSSVVDLLGESLGLEGGELGAPFEPDRGFCRALYYSNAAASSDGVDLGIPAHSDAGTVTLVVSDRPGLEAVCPSTGRWVAVPYAGPHLIAVNLGDFFSLWTGGAWRATVHRVAPPPPEGRASIAYFASQVMDEHAPREPVAPLAPFAERAAAAGYRPVAFKEYLEARTAHISKKMA